MASELKSLSDIDLSKLPEATGWKFTLVVSSYHNDITFPLRDGAVEMLKAKGVSENDIRTEFVPGTYELTSAAQMVAESSNSDAIICLGCVIKGQTDHDKYINHAVAQGLTKVGLEYRLPVIFGVLTPNTHEQATDRAGGKHGNKGHEAAAAALEMVAMRKRLLGQKQKAGF